jgi:hypothetical protein
MVYPTSFSLQDAITVELAHVLAVRLPEVESRRSERSSSADGFDLVMRARAFRNRGTSRENYARAANLYEKALQLSPDDVQALTGLSVVLAGNSAMMWSEARDEDLLRAEALAARASVLNPYDAHCHVAMRLVRRMQTASTKRYANSRRRSGSIQTCHQRSPARFREGFFQVGARMPCPAS